MGSARDRLSVERRAHPAVPGGDAAWTEVVFRVNGKLFTDLLKEVEAPYAEAEGNPSLAGDYLGPPLRLAEPLLLNEQRNDEGKTMLLGCTCGIPECWPMYVKIDIHSATVTWSDFEQPFRSWAYNMGPFTFDRREYESVVASLRTARKQEALD